MVGAYLVLIEGVKTWFYRRVVPTPQLRERRPGHRIRRRAARFTQHLVRQAA